ncbi:MAG: TldD/PmbA family protein [Nitrospinae bacterium]|nr:TldD/PmbA family protein [Nitrospinota bacterium]
MVEKADWMAEALDLGRQRSQGEVELYLLRERSLHIKVFEGKVDSLDVAEYQGLGLRVIREGRCGTSYTERLEREAIEEAIRGAIENSTISPADPFQGLEGADPSLGQIPPLELLDEEIAQQGEQKKIDLALALEQTARDFDPKIVNVPYASYYEAFREVRLMNSRGREGAYARGGAGLAIETMAQAGDQVKSCYQSQYALHFGDLDAKELARKTAEEGIRRLGASELDSASYPVVLLNEVTRGLLATFSSSFSARNVQKGLSLLAGRMGEAVARPELTLRDDALLPGGYASRPFDDEGTPSRQLDLIRQGTLSGYLYNGYAARKDGVVSTGHAARGSVKSAVEIAPSNLYLVPGEKSLEELLSAAGSGVLIVDVEGLHSGANPISGDFSLGAQGYRFDAGGTKRPVHNFTVAGNFYQLLKEIVEIGRDLEFSPPMGGTAVGCPSLLVSRMALSGK